MTEQIEALRYDLLCIMADLIQAEEEATALEAVRLISARIDAALGNAGGNRAPA